MMIQLICNFVFL